MCIRWLTRHITRLWRSFRNCYVFRILIETIFLFGCVRQVACWVVGRRRVLRDGGIRDAVVRCEWIRVTRRSQGGARETYILGRLPRVTHCAAVRRGSLQQRCVSARVRDAVNAQGVSLGSLNRARRAVKVIHAVLSLELNQLYHVAFLLRRTAASCGFARETNSHHMPIAGGGHGHGRGRIRGERRGCRIATSTALSTSRSCSAAPSGPSPHTQALDLKWLSHLVHMRLSTLLVCEGFCFVRVGAAARRRWREGAAGIGALAAQRLGYDADAAAARRGCSTGRDASSTSARPQRAVAAAAAGTIAAGLDAVASGATAHAAHTTCIPALSAAQSAAMRGWLGTSILSTGTGRWPANGESRADIAGKLRELGVSAEQAKKALAKLRLTGSTILRWRWSISRKPAHAGAGLELVKLVHENELNQFCICVNSLYL